MSAAVVGRCLRRNVKTYKFVVLRNHQNIKPLVNNFTNDRAFQTSGCRLSDTWSEAEAAEREAAEAYRRRTEEEELIKKKILSASLPHVAKHGWSRLAVAAGAEDQGYISVVSGLFPREGVDLIVHHIQESNEKLDKWMIEEVEKYKMDGGKVPVGRFIRSAVQRRLLMNQEYVTNGRWAEALAVLAKPQNVVESVGLLQQLCDDIWFRAGDVSADMSWYSKRMLLAGVISSTEVFMLQDTSANFKETWNFLDRRFEDIAGIPQIMTKPQDVTALLCGLAATARNIVGVQT